MNGPWARGDCESDTHRRRSKHDLHGGSDIAGNFRQPGPAGELSQETAQDKKKRGSEQTAAREIVGKPDKLVNSRVHSPGLYRKTAPAA